MRIKELLKNKKGDAVQAVYIMFFVLVSSLILIQIITLFTAAYTVRQKANHSLALLEASITEDVYESLPEKDFDLYDVIVDEDGVGINPYYSYLYAQIFQANLGFEEDGDYYDGPYYSINKNSIDLQVQKIDNYNIRFILTFQINYHLTVVGFKDTDVDIVSDTITLKSDYNFHGSISDDGSDIEENTSQYADQGLGA